MAFNLQLQPTPKRSPYVEQLLQPTEIQAFSKGPQIQEAILKALSQGLGGYLAGRGERKEEARKEGIRSQLADILGSQRSGFIEDKSKGFGGGFGVDTQQLGGRDLLTALAGISGVEEGDINEFQKLAIQERIKEPPTFDSIQLYPPRGSDPSVKARVITNPVEANALFAGGWTKQDMRQAPEGQLITGQQLIDDFNADLPEEYGPHLFTHVDGKNIVYKQAPPADSQSSIEEKIALYESLDIEPDRARVLAVGGEEPQFDPTSNRFIGTYDKINRKFTPVEELISGEGAPKEPDGEKPYTGNILLDPAAYPAEGSLLSNLDQFGFTGSTREIIAKSPIARKAIDEWFIQIMEGGAELFGIDPPEGINATQEEVVHTRTKYRQFQLDAIRALKQTSRVSVPEQQRIINMLPDLGWWENPDSAGAALRSIAHNMGEVLKANVEYGDDPLNPTTVRTEAQRKAWALSSALKQIGFNPVGSNFVTKEGIEQLTLREIQEAHPALISELIDNSPHLFEMINARRKRLEKEAIESGEILEGLGGENG